LRLLTSREMATVGGKFTSRCTWLLSPLNSRSSAPKSAHTSRMISSSRSRCSPAKISCRYLVTNNQMGDQDENTMSASADVLITGHETKRALGMRLRYNYRLYPTPGQRSALARAFGCARVAFNDGLAARRAAHEAGLPYITDAELSAALAAAKRAPERAWLGEVSAVVLQQALADLNAAYRNFFASLKGERKGPRARPPRFRSRKDRRQAIRFTANARFSITLGGKLRLPKIGDVDVRWSRDLPSVPSSVTVIMDAAGRYFASFVVDAGEDPLPEVASEAGIDLGLTHFAVMSDGRKVASPKFLRRAERRLRKAQQMLSRCQKGSANRDRARVRVARQHAKVADSRRDWLHKLSTEIIRENQAVYVEDLCVAGLARTRLAKSISDAGWSAFTSMLEYKARRHGRTFARIGRFEPTSQVCSACGVKDGPKPLSVREWACAACGTVHDRDVNAARNVLALGRRESLNACGGIVRPALVLADPGETGSRRGAA
jgi:IS605 OrfB family transposase